MHLQWGGVSYKESEDIFKNELPKFSSISIREPGFIEDIKKISGKDVVDVCDPALLLLQEDYEKIEKKKKFLPKRYIAVMKLKSDSITDLTAFSLSKKLGIPTVGIFGGPKSGYDRTFLSLSPQQWLYVMRNADYIVTDSFHGSVFSIVFRKPFVSVCGVQHLERNERITNLLQQTGLLDRYIINIDSLTSLSDIDYTSCEHLIEKYRNRSLAWLKDALEKAVNDKNNK